MIVRGHCVDTTMQRLALALLFLVHVVLVGAARGKHALLKSHLNSQKNYLKGQRQKGGRIMPVTTVIPPKTKYERPTEKYPSPTPEHVKNLTPKDSVRTHNLLSAGYVSKHYLDLNPNALDSGYTNYKENNIGIPSDPYNRPPYGRNWGEKKSPGLQIEPLYYNPTDPSGGAFNSAAIDRASGRRRCKRCEPR